MKRLMTWLRGLWPQRGEPDYRYIVVHDGGNKSPLPPPKKRKQRSAACTMRAGGGDAA
jgi:hypothetical protein